MVLHELVCQPRISNLHKPNEAALKRLISRKKTSHCDDGDDKK